MKFTETQKRILKRENGLVTATSIDRLSIERQQRHAIDPLDDMLIPIYGAEVRSAEALERKGHGYTCSCQWGKANWYYRPTKAILKLAYED